MASEQKFFSTQNLHQAIWALVIGAVAFTCGLIFTKVTGAEKVVVATPADGAAPVVVRIERSPDDPDFLTVERLNSLSKALEDLAARSSLEGGQQAVTSTLNRPMTPAFNMPVNVQGYLKAPIAGFGKARCPEARVTRDEVFLVQLDLNPNVRTTALSPIYLRVDRPSTPNEVTQVYEQQYELHTGLNSFVMGYQLPIGNYEMALGFYATSELSRAFPNFYSLDCQFSVVATR